ncbi:DUF928 domain-containing protein [Calothrix sp. PCC 6303]|uniref:DUF928 domain-containing protein n=1 Tax=Calothrix sp. PCC 6303 TaxID=1170562 RepID=UPI0002A03DCD|nr:DUF928 domain-containing protein [Calothrix sp. PCC 6303]AFY99398.1 protein of unknown function DUF928 [Calothrix sp. PCC 6303]
MKGLFFLAWILMGWASYAVLLASAQTNTINDSVSLSPVSLLTKLPANLPASLMIAEKAPPSRGTPPGKEGTGSRGDCLEKANTPPITRIIGAHQSRFTVSDRPTIWIYLPYTTKDASSGEFSLQDGDTEIFRDRIQLPSQPGIVGIRLPNKIAALKVDREYRWYVDINCSGSGAESDSQTPASLTGIVEKKLVSGELQQDLQIAKSSLDRVLVYGKYQIWYDAITELAQLRLQEPNNSLYRKVWVELLNNQDINLGYISQQPIVMNMVFE